jgi:hypothetical protein
MKGLTSNGHFRIQKRRLGMSARTRENDDRKKATRRATPSLGSTREACRTYPQRRGGVPVADIYTAFL